MHLIFILITAIFGGPLGTLLFAFAVNKIERRKSANSESCAAQE